MSGPLGSQQWMYSTGAAEEGQSLRFEDGDSAYLSWTPASAGTRSTWTFSAWVKRGNLGEQDIFGGGTGSDGFVKFRSDNTLQFGSYVSGYVFDLRSNAVYRDVGAWMHIVAVFDTGNATSTLRQRLFVNGAEVSYGTQSNTTSNTAINNNVVHYIGHVGSSGSALFYDGYMSEIVFIDGQALDPTSFGEYQDTLWKPKSSTDIKALTFGTNGFYLDFADSADIGADVSGNANDFTASGLAATDVVLDSPVTGDNFATLNPLVRNANTFSEGNLKMVCSASTPAKTVSTIGVSSGKWYSEWLIGPYTSWPVGISKNTLEENYLSSYSIAYWPYSGGAFLYVEGTNITGIGALGTTTWASGDILGFAFDADIKSITIVKNGTNIGSFDFSAYSGWDEIYFAAGNYVNGNTYVVNFGQDSTFAGNRAAGGNTDDNGIGDFAYPVPSGGYLALCTANLPTPTIADPTEYFNTVLYTGTSATRSVTGFGHQPDWLWTKARNNASNHALVDSVRGTNKLLLSDLSDSEYTQTIIDSFDSDGFTTSSISSAINLSGYTYVAWGWKAGGTAVSNTDGSITSQVSANTDAGFSIVGYTSNASGQDTVGHGLTSTPELIITKSRDDSLYNWSVFHTDVCDTTSKYLKLNTTDALSTYSTIWGAALPTSSVFGITSGGGVAPSDACIAYCFHSVPGYSKINIYTGNGSSDGPFVDCGFRPAWIMFKRTDAAANWWIIDNKRDTFNQMANILLADSNSAEFSTGTGWPGIDYLANGFKLRGSAGGMNASGGTYIFLAFSESPFAFSNAR